VQRIEQAYHTPFNKTKIFATKIALDMTKINFFTIQKCTKQFHKEIIISSSFLFNIPHTILLMRSLIPPIRGSILEGFFYDIYYHMCEDADLPSTIINVI
jgi:hypothetical protein